MHKRILLILLICFANFNVFSQNEVDSILSIANNPSTNDSLKAECYNSLALHFIYSNPDSSFLLAKKANFISKKHRLLVPLLTSTDHIARIWWIRGKLDSSLYYINKKLRIYDSIGDNFGVSASYNNLGMIAENKGDFPTSHNLYMKSITILEEIKQTTNNIDTLSAADDRLASTFNNIGNIYARQENTKDAKIYYEKALTINIKLNNKRKKAVNYSNIGICAIKEDEFNDAIVFLNKALVIHQELNDKYGQAEVYENLASAFVNLKKLPKAEATYLRSIEICDELQNDYSKCAAYVGLADVYFLQNKINAMVKILEKAKKLAYTNNFDEYKAAIHQGFAKAYYHIGEYKKAYNEFKKFTLANDSIYNSEKNKQIEELKTIYETDKKEKEILLLNKDKQLSDLALLQKDKIIEKQRLKNMLYAVIAISFLLISFVLLRTIQVKKKANKKIEEQKKLLEETNEELNQQNEEILAQRDEIEHQKNIVDFQNKELTDSINAAERIQQAFFTFEEKEHKNIPSHFVIFNPLKKVSGDFYWFKKQGDYIYIAVVDCTGHGVPGALMSMLGASLLTEIVTNNTNLEPAKILDILKERIVKELNQNNISSTNKDGMDVSLIKLNPQKLTLTFAGANNPLYITKKNLDDVIIIKANRQPIGVSELTVPFQNHAIILEKGDCIYLFSDGYADQFGGRENKKMGYKRFRDVLAQYKNRDVLHQKTGLEEFFNQWKGNEEQVDDVCIVGLQI